MKRMLSLALCLVFLNDLHPQPAPVKGPLSFHEGEKLMFRVYYHSALTGNVTAGHASLEVMTDRKVVLNKPVYHVVGEGVSGGAFDWFYKVRDRFESFIDKETLEPLYFIRRTREGDYKKDDEIVFDHKNRIATSRTRKTSLRPGTQDLVSAFYYARNINFTDVRIGDTFPVNFFLNDSVYVSIIKYLGKEKVKTKSGTFRCLKFKPMVATGKVFSDQYPMTLWVTDDANRLPVMVESAVVVGSVKMELESWSDIAHPLTAKLN